MLLLRNAVLVSSFCSFGACAATAPGSAGFDPHTIAFDPALYPGVWVSDGYGYVFDFRSDSVRLFHSAGTTCVEEPDVPGSILPHLDLARAEGAGDVLVLLSVLDPYEYRFRRVPDLPPACVTPAPTTASSTFEAFSAFFAEHYAFFDLYGVDWETRVDEGRRRLPADGDERALFELLRELIVPLRDSHIKLVAEFGGERLVHDGNPGPTGRALEAAADRRGLPLRDVVSQFRREYWFDGIQQSLLRGTGTITAGGRMQYGMLSADVGYLAVVSMGGFASGDVGTLHEELSALDAAMEDALGLFASRGARAVIVDLSLNTGGYDFVARAIAGRFASDRALAYTMRAGDDPRATPYPMFVEPAGGRRFTGPVYLLTSDMTSSAGEVAVLCFRTQPHVRHLGEPTRGGLSTVLSKPLPNGWRLSLSNEVFADSRGEVWEGRGIPPDVLIPVFHPQDPMRGHVEAVTSVLEIIGSTGP